MPSSPILEGDSLVASLPKDEHGNLVLANQIREEWYLDALKACEDELTTDDLDQMTILTERKAERERTGMNIEAWFGPPRNARQRAIVKAVRAVQKERRTRTASSASTASVSARTASPRYRSRATVRKP